VEFSVLGGPLHRLGCRLGLVRANSTTLPLGLVLGFSTWLILLLLELIDGNARRLFTLGTIAVHARMLLVIPLFFSCEALLNRHAQRFVSYLTSSGIVAGRVVPQLDAATARTRRWTDAWQPDALCLVAALLLSLAAPDALRLASPEFPVPWISVAIDPAHPQHGISLAGWWYWIFALTLFRFLLLRWLWRLCAWCQFLWALSRLDLRLLPTHPDETGGLGGLDNVQVRFIPLILAFSVVDAASFAESLSAGTMTLPDTFPIVIATLVLDTLLFAAPLLIFVPALLKCREVGLIEYMGLASQYVGEFDDKWLRSDTAKKELLGTADLQSLADLGNSVNVISRMRFMPLTPRTLISFVIAALLPMLPLLLFRFPPADLFKYILRALTGLT
jgi:hypothetical protein